MKLIVFVCGVVAGAVAATWLASRPTEWEKLTRNLDREWARIAENLKAHRE